MNLIWKEASNQQQQKNPITNTGVGKPVPPGSIDINPSVNNLKQIWIEASSKGKNTSYQPIHESTNRPTYHDDESLFIDYEHIGNLQPSSNDVITVNGMTGVWVNKEECLNWRGPIPLEQYRINNDPNPTIIRKKRTMDVEATQRISVRFLKPPQLPIPGDLVIKEDNKVQQFPPAPPIIIRQQAEAMRTQAPMVIREKPPRAPSNVPVQTITIPGKGMLDPPPRQVIIERVPTASTTPQEVIVERWLGYPRQKRNIIYEKSQSHESVTYQKPQNIIIDWETTGHANIDTNLNKQVKFLGVETADPIEYTNHYSNELIDSHKLPHLVNEYKTPQEEVLASNSTSNEFILTGDIDALKLVNREELNKYLLTKF